MSSSFELTLWQKKQAALLYHFTSLEYLRGLQQRIHDLMKFADKTLDLAKLENRDSVLIDSRWGNRNTSQNWSDNAWGFVADFELDVARDIALRSFEKYDRSGADQCARGLNEYSMAWATQSEEDEFRVMIESISEYARLMDNALDKTTNESRFKDFNFACAWAKCKHQFSKLPKFRVRTDVEGNTGCKPFRTGVYVPTDDPNGSLQFGWSGGTLGKLINCNTFNEIGKDALIAVGRRDLWFNEQKMFLFATSAKYIEEFRERVIWDGVPQVDLAPSAVARKAFTARPTTWYFVEVVEGEFETYDDNDIPGVILKRIRVEGGDVCPESGYYFTPVNPTSRRHFKQGEIMPIFQSTLWKTIWQWDEQQMCAR